MHRRYICAQVFARLRAPRMKVRRADPSSHSSLWGAASSEPKYNSVHLLSSSSYWRETEAREVRVSTTIGGHVLSQEPSRGQEEIFNTGGQLTSVT